VEPGLIARTLNSLAGKNHPQSDRVYLVIHTLHARRNEDWDFGASHNVGALRAAQILHGFPQKIPSLDVRNYHAVGVTGDRMDDALGLCGGLQKCTIERKRAEDFCVTELAGLTHCGEISGVHTRGQRLTDRFRGAHNRDLRARQSQRTHDFDCVLHDLLLLFQVGQDV